jgi:hypothetical protein
LSQARDTVDLIDGGHRGGPVGQSGEHGVERHGLSRQGGLQAGEVAVFDSFRSRHQRRETFGDIKFFKRASALPN